jgi:four helix bundle protein
MQDPANLQVWHRSLDVAARVHALAKRLRAADAPGLRNQLCRAASSIPANIAEGARQDGSAQFARFLGYAIGSTGEVESHLVLASRLSPAMGDTSEALADLSEIRRMLYALRAHHQRSAG